MDARVSLAILAVCASCSMIGSATAKPYAHWPKELRVGNGYPHSEDPCRRVGETPATVDFLDDSATLVGCPSKQSAAHIRGKVVGNVRGIILISAPNGDTLHPADADAKVPATKFNATAAVPCQNVGGSSPTCDAGVIRSSDQIAVEIKLPDGMTRVLLFDPKGKFITHASAQADGSAALQSSARRESDWTIVTVGREQYRIPDAFVLGD